MFSSERGIKENHEYFFNARGSGDFGDAATIPRFLRSEGNFASLVCHFFTPYEPQRHDGSCGINSFLMALNGRGTYEGPEGSDKLAGDIRDFRKKVRKYAEDHKAELKKKYSKKEFKKFFDEFASDEYAANAYMSTVAWECAAKIYGRKIWIYSRTADSFRTDKKGEIEPAATFEPLASDQPPIELLYWDQVHYCELERRN